MVEEPYGKNLAQAAFDWRLTLEPKSSLQITLNKLLEALVFFFSIFVTLKTLFTYWKAIPGADFITLVKWLW